MRLIDADKLPVTNVIEGIHGKEVYVNPWISALAIENAPTVEAIPISWLRKINAMCGQETRLQEALDLWESKNGRSK